MTVSCKILQTHKVEVTSELFEDLKSGMVEELEAVSPMISVQEAVHAISRRVCCKILAGQKVSSVDTDLLIEDVVKLGDVVRQLIAASDREGPLRLLLHRRVVEILQDALEGGITSADGTSSDTMKCVGRCRAKCRGQCQGSLQSRLCEGTSNNAALNTFRNQVCNGKKTGLIIMASDIEIMLEGIVNCAKLHYIVHLPLIQTVIASYQSFNIPADSSKRHVTISPTNITKTGSPDLTTIPATPKVGVVPNISSPTAAAAQHNLPCASSLEVPVATCSDVFGAVSDSAHKKFDCCLESVEANGTNTNPSLANVTTTKMSALLVKGDVLVVQEDALLVKEGIKVTEGTKSEDGIDEMDGRNIMDVMDDEERTVPFETNLHRDSVTSSLLTPQSQSYNEFQLESTIPIPFKTFSTDTDTTLSSSPDCCLGLPRLFEAVKPKESTPTIDSNNCELEPDSPSRMRWMSVG